MEIQYKTATRVILTPTAPDGRITNYQDGQPPLWYIGAVKVSTNVKNIGNYHEITAAQHAAYQAAYDAAFAAQQEEEGNEIP